MNISEMMTDKNKAEYKNPFLRKSHPLPLLGALSNGLSGNCLWSYVSCMISCVYC